jgi:hypothetical protein
MLYKSIPYSLSQVEEHVEVNCISWFLFYAVHVFNFLFGVSKR